jgi:hypothetical protein
MENLWDIAKEIQKKKTELKLDDITLEIASKIFISRNISNDKKKFNEQTEDKDLATEKQIYAIEKAGKVVPIGLTKFEASKIIHEIKGGK